MSVPAFGWPLGWESIELNKILDYTLITLWGNLQKVKHLMKMKTGYYSFRGVQNLANDFLTQGTVFRSINKTDLAKQTLISPNQIICYTFNKNISHIDNKIENQTLTKIRDTLLAQLLSGKLRIADVENFIKD